MRDYILNYLKSDLTPGQAGNWVWALIYILVIFAGASVAVMLMVWLERKILAHMQVRLGPMRVGPHGLLQPIADSLKLLIKEDIIPTNADKLVFWLAPLIVVLSAFTTYVVIPFGPTHAVTDMNIGLLFMVGVSSIGVLGIIMAGWASNSHYPLMGSLRSSAQMVSYEIAMGMAVVSVVLMTSLNPTGSGTLSMIGIVQAQYAQGTWFLFGGNGMAHLGWIPGIAGFVIFAIAMVAETNRAPFDLPEAESELVAGFHTEYSGFRWSLFFLGEYAAMIAVSSVATTLWLGGWLRPFPHWHGPAVTLGSYWNPPAGAGLGVVDFAFSLFPALTFLGIAAIALIGARRMPRNPLLKLQTAGLGGFGVVLAIIGLALLAPPVRDRVQDIFWFVAKIGVFMYFYIWYRGTFPRYRFDQLMKVGWKVLIPTGIAVLIVTAGLGLVK